MKGFVFHINKSRPVSLNGIKERALSLREIVKRYGVQAFFGTLFVMGLAVGAACSRSFDRELLERLDFIFVTNISSRMSMTPFGIFSSCFVSYFVFIFLMLLFAASAWGFAAVPLLFVVKGFSVGLSSAFLFSEYSAPGIGFYILIVLPGAVGFLFTMIRYSRECFALSLDYAGLSVFGFDRAASLRSDIKGFLLQSLYAFILSAACAVGDMLLWVLFADKFHFY